MQELLLRVKCLLQMQVLPTLVWFCWHTHSPLLLTKGSGQGVGLSTYITELLTLTYRVLLSEKDNPTM